MDKAALLALADRVEALVGPNEETDVAIAVAVSGDPGAWVVEPHEGSIFSHKPGWYATSDNKSHKAVNYTASLDAAMTLIEDGDEWSLSTIYCIARAEIGINRNHQTSWPGNGEHAGCSPVLALLSAALRAKALS